jgi:hypothetical protein
MVLMTGLTGNIDKSEYDGEDDGEEEDTRGRRLRTGFDNISQCFILDTIPDCNYLIILTH